MKKVSRTIAMILVLVMLASSFTSCWSGPSPREVLEGTIMVGLLCLIALIVFSVSELPGETGIYLAGVGDNNPDNYYSAMEILNSLPEVERIALMEKINSIPEAKRADLAGIINDLPETEIAYSIERVNALSKTKLTSAVRSFNSLSEEELDSFTEQLKSLSKTEYIASMDYSREKAYMGISFKY
jgi:hypothetical protein